MGAIPKAMDLTVVCISSRDEPRFEWLRDSLWGQDKSIQVNTVISNNSQHVPAWMVNIHAKPTIWQGPSRITKEDWWAASNARNTGLCFVETSWVAFVDDRTVLSPTWLEAVKAAMLMNYCVVGPYTKVHNLVVTNGKVVSYTDIGCVDSRLQYVRDHYRSLPSPYVAPGEWTYGATIALPLEWCLAVNGFSEDLCDGLSGEDYCFGLTLTNNGYPIRFDTRMAIMQDRTPGQTGPTMRREDKGTSPNDKSHACLAKFRNAKTSMNSYDLRKLRRECMEGHPFPAPSASHLDWYDGTPIC